MINYDFCNYNTKCHDFVVLSSLNSISNKNHDNENYNT